MILQHLYKNTLRTDLNQGDSNVIDITFMALMNVLHYINMPELSKNYLYNFIDQFKNSYTLANTQVRVSLQSGLLSSIHVIITNIL